MANKKHTETLEFLLTDFDEARRAYAKEHGIDLGEDGDEEEPEDPEEPPAVAV